ncbi:MAG: hypothetical protein AB1Z19_06460 [Eubacteriales bacterium]
MIRKDYFVRFAYTAIISVVISLVVSALVDTVDFTALSLAKSVALGAAIWLSAEFLTEFSARRWPHRIMPGYIALFIIIALGTGLGTWLMGLGPIKTILLVCICAEIFGFAIAVTYHMRYTKKLNDQLKQYKNKIEETD